MTQRRASPAANRSPRVVARTSTPKSPRSSTAAKKPSTPVRPPKFPESRLRLLFSTGVILGLGFHHFRVLYPKCTVPYLLIRVFLAETQRFKGPELDTGSSRAAGRDHPGRYRRLVLRAAKVRGPQLPLQINHTHIWNICSVSVFYSALYAKCP